MFGSDLRCVKKRVQKELSERLVKAFAQGKVGALGDDSIDVSSLLAEDEVPAPWHIFTPVLSTAFASARKEALPAKEELRAIYDDAVERALEWTDVRLIADLRLVAVVVNKRAEGNVFFSVSLSRICSAHELMGGGGTDLGDLGVSRLWNDVVADVRVDMGRRRAALRVSAWIARALVVRGDVRGEELVQRIVGLLADGELGRDAARSLGTVIDDDQLLSRERFSVVKVSVVCRMSGSCLALKIDDGAVTIQKDTSPTTVLRSGTSERLGRHRAHRGRRRSAYCASHCTLRARSPRASRRVYPYPTASPRA
jgi:hypothetical protein